MIAATTNLVDVNAVPIGYMDQEIWENTMQLVLEQNLIENPIDLDQLYTTQFLTQ